MIKKILFLLLFIFLIYIFFIEPSIFIKVENIEIKANVSNEIKIIHISDLHMSRYYFFHDLILNKIENINHDIIIYTGDSLKKNTDQKSLNKFFKNLADISDVYLVYGNWDFYDINKVNQAYNISNIHIVDNNPKKFYIGSQEVIINGIPIYYPLEYIERTEKSYNVFLTHIPENIFKNRNVFKHANLILAGHNHGGQFYVPYITNFIMKNFKEESDFIRGLYELQNIPFYINRGLGSWYNLRFLSPPEITLITIKPN